MVGGLIYTGVGSRQTPPKVCALMSRLASRLESLGWHLRSGGAVGADAAFESGVLDRNKLTLFVAWKKRGQDSRCVCPEGQTLAMAEAIAAEIHPVWIRMGGADRALHSRNVLQVLGANLDKPSTMLVCWTPDGAQSEAETSRQTGGTRTAIVVAERNGVAVVNLKRDGAMERLRQIVTQAQDG